MRTSSAWILCIASTVGCGLGNPDLRSIPDVVPMEVDSGEGLDGAIDLGAPIDAPDAAPDGGGAEDSTALDSGDDAPDASVIDHDIGDASDDVAGDGPTSDAGDAAVMVDAPDVLDGGALDAPVDVPIDLGPTDLGSDLGIVDAPTDAGLDVPPVDVPPVDVPPADVPPVDVPPVDVGFPIRWNVSEGDIIYTPWRSSEPSSSIDNVRCGPGRVLVGLTTWSGIYVSGLAPWCAPLNPDGNLGMAVQGGRQGGTSGGSDDDLCPANQVIVRFTINSGGVIDRLQATCAPLGAWLASRTFGAQLRAHGDSTGGSRTQDDCPAGYMGVGYDLRDGDFNFIERVQNLRLRCARVSDR
ncbi:MAG: hypothetical protein Q8S73_30140 [Deltaproteobacteria bacterium]|nr:hypothetical protein [Myxococcales bacterium]MDP3218403.1 hypothetical protein [Deltaproteobacteria bacterium]